MSEIWHPDLAPVERDALATLFAAKDRFTVLELEMARAAARLVFSSSLGSVFFRVFSVVFSWRVRPRVPAPPPLVSVFFRIFSFVFSSFFGSVVRSRARPSGRRAAAPVGRRRCERRGDLW